MAMTLLQKQTLNAYADSQPALKSYAQLTGKYADDIKLGDMISGDGMVNALRDKYFTWTGNMPAPDAGGLVVRELPIFQAPCDGYVISGNVYCYDSFDLWTAGTAAIQNYLVYPYVFYSTHGGYVGTPVSLITGMENNSFAPIALSEDVPLVTATNTYAIAVSTKTITMTATTTFANLPNVGDLIYIRETSTNFRAANLVNVGIYLVTAVTGSTVITAIKQGRTNPVAVSAVAAISADEGGFRLSRASPGMPVYAGDTFG